MCSERFDELIARAHEMRGLAYAPYSKFAVGAALLAESGEIFGGANVENASYGLAICAERAAAVSAVAAGQRRFRAIAIAGPPAASTPPCGACRQFLSEFGSQIAVLYTTPDGVTRTTIAQLLPGAFAL